jgi:hypothetical protein
MPVSWLVMAFIFWCAWSQTKRPLTQEQYLNAVDRCIYLAIREDIHDEGLFYDRVRVLLEELRRYQEEGDMMGVCSSEMAKIVDEVRGTPKK